MSRPLTRTLCATAAAAGVTLALLFTPAVGRAEPFFWDFLDGDWLMVQISRAAAECRQEQAQKDAEPPATPNQERQPRCITPEHALQQAREDAGAQNADGSVPPCEATRDSAEREKMRKAIVALNLKLAQVSAQAAAQKKQLELTELQLKKARARVAEMEKKAREETSAVTEPKPDPAAMERRMKEMEKKIDQLIAELATLRSLQQTGWWGIPPTVPPQPPTPPNPYLNQYPQPIPYTPLNTPQQIAPHVQPVMPPGVPSGPHYHTGTEVPGTTAPDSYSAPVVPLTGPRAPANSR
jgi:hypothetical protein